MNWTKNQMNLCLCQNAMMKCVDDVGDDAKQFRDYLKCRFFQLDGDVMMVHVDHKDGVQLLRPQQHYLLDQHHRQRLKVLQTQNLVPNDFQAHLMFDLNQEKNQRKYFQESNHHPLLHLNDDGGGNYVYNVVVDA